jgi:ribonuclease HII
MAKPPRCSFALEKAARSNGALRIAGLDEVGRGPLFGPVVAAAVILPESCRFRGLTDSKLLTENQRNELEPQIRLKAIAWAIAVVDAETIDRINIRQASLLAMRQAVEQLTLSPDFLLIDGRDSIDWPCPQQSVIHGDSTSLSIAAASVIAKVYRDRLLVELDSQFPGYGLARHKGYGSREHLAALARLGPTPLHRKTFHPVAQTALQFTEN